ncbi:MAG: hypothetical protein M5U01_29190 [Ardenticatenaceae bacterium]|nr:hypothetical protein [Ardenticatenaceae bacterium]HBY98607.1 hypothetical protein [Chloroflexota bacterium]
MLLAWLSRRLAPKRICDHCRHFHHFQALADGGVGRFHTVEVCRNPASPFHNLPVPPARTCDFFEQVQEPANR